MNKVKKLKFKDRVRGAWGAFRGKPVDSITVGIDVKRCIDCEYRYTAEDSPPPAQYFHELRYLNNIVVVILYEATEDGKVELARGHGHIIHQGAEGTAQATSYAMRRLWDRLRKQTESRTGGQDLDQEIPEKLPKI